MNKILWAAIALPLEVWFAVAIVRIGDPIVAGLLLVVIAFIAAAAIAKQVTPWDFVISTFRWGAIVLLIFGGLILGAGGMLFYGGKMTISSLPWPRIVLFALISAILSTFALAIASLMRMPISSLWVIIVVSFFSIAVIATLNHFSKRS